ncbi:MAG: hypothetical protein HRT34_12450 [Alcanivorax sp.]|nr:hypothetical protein [Alcanivorax sp.]
MSNKASATLAVLVVAAGGGNAAISNQTGQDVREMRAVVQELSRDVSLLKWRVTSLEGEGNGEG